MRHGIGKLGGIHSAQLPSKHSGPSYTAGLFRSQYGPNPNWVNNAPDPSWGGWTSTAKVTAVVTDFDLTLTSAETQRAYEWKGYFLPDYTGTWTFSTGGANVDDALALWIGPNAVTGNTTGNAVFSVSLTAGSGTVSLTAGTYYPIRVQFGNNAGPGSTTILYAHTGQTITKSYTGKIFYNPSTNGF